MFLFSSSETWVIGTLDSLRLSPLQLWSLSLSFILITLSCFLGFHLFLSFNHLLSFLAFIFVHLFLNNVITDSRYVLISEMLTVFNLVGNIVDSLQLCCSILKETFVSRKPFTLIFWIVFLIVVTRLPVIVVCLPGFLCTWCQSS